MRSKQSRTGFSLSTFVSPATGRPIAAILLLGVLWYFSPAPDPRFRLCGFYWLTGHECPFCGLTRALFALAKGDWAAALQFNALSPLGFAMLFSLFWKTPGRGRLWAAGLACFAAYGIVRQFVTV